MDQDEELTNLVNQYLMRELKNDSLLGMMAKSDKFSNWYGTLATASTKLGSCFQFLSSMDAKQTKSMEKYCTGSTSVYTSR